MSETLKERFSARGQDAFGQFFLAAFSLIVLLTPLSGYIGSPALWVIADFSAAVFVVMILMGKDDWFGRIYAISMFAGMTIISLYMFADGIVVAPVLFALWCWRSYTTVIKGHSRAMDEAIRSTCAVMVAGIPAMIVYSWSDSEPVIVATISVPFFVANGWLYLYPPSEWLVEIEE